MRRRAPLGALLLFLLALFAAPSLARAYPDGLPVTEVELINPTRVPDQEVLRIFEARTGFPYDARRVTRSIGLIGRQAGVENAIIYHRPDGDGVRVRLILVAEPLIRNVTLRGLDVVEEDELRARLMTQVDEPVSSAYIGQDVESIADRYREEGYPWAEVTVEVKTVTPDRWVDVVFRVKEGKPERIARLGEIGDCGYLGWGRVESLIGLGVGRPASERMLRTGVRKLLDYAHEKNYPEARIVNARFERTSEGVLLHLPFEVGQETRIAIDLDSEWRPQELWTELRSRMGAPIDENWIQQVSAAFRDTLHELGYPGAEVSVVETPEDAARGKSREIRFKISVGPKTYLDEVFFVGNERVDAKTLRERMRIWEESFFGTPRFRRGAIEQDLAALKAYYATLGMLDARLEIDSTEVNEVGEGTVTVKVYEGPVYRFGAMEVSIDGDGITEEKVRALSDVREGEPANPITLDKSRVRIHAELLKRGYLDANVRQKVKLAPDAQSVNVSLSVRTGPLYRVGTVVVEGNARTRSEVILREVTLETGQPWNQQEVLLSQRSIFNLGFFQDVRFERVGGIDDEGQSDVVIRVREQDAGYVDYGIGYGTEEGVLGFFEVGHANLAGAGRSVSLRLEAQQSDQSYALNYLEPWILDYPYDLRLSVIHQELDRKAYQLSSTAFQASLDHEFSLAARGSLIYTLESNRLSDVDEGAILVDEDDEPYVLSSIGPLLVWDTRDDPFNPRKGANHAFQAEWALEALGSQVTFGRYTGFISGFIPWGKQQTFALMARGGFADNFGGTASLPVNKRFFLGGRSTVRGFARDAVGPTTSDGTPIGGDVMANFKAEWRFPIYRKFGGTIFWDAGQVWLRDQDSISITDLRQAAGFGFRYLTPVGPITFDIGYKIDRKEGESPSEWHFTIGNVF